MDKEFKDAFDLLQKIVKNNCKIITPDDLNKQKFLLHISSREQSTLTPNVSRRSALSEDNTVARVHTSDNLFGCILGYASAADDITNSHPKQKDYKGGFYIYAIDFDYALDPNTKLVYDADVTNEKWLITFNKNTVNYKTRLIGKLISDFSTYERRDNNYPIIKSAFALELTHGLYLTRSNLISGDKNNYLEPGHYTFIGNETNAKVDKFIKINKKQYDDIKNLKATLLSYSDGFTKW